MGGSRCGRIVRFARQTSRTFNGLSVSTRQPKGLARCRVNRGCRERRYARRSRIDFGGKSRVAELVWSRLGNVPTYNEPFAGSLAVLLGRPTAPRVETVNDKDCMLANFWRAVQHDPDEVAYWADAPVNEADLHARHLWLVTTARQRAERTMTEPDYYDAQIAGWWVWGVCLWIGSGWCTRPEWTGRANAGRRPRGVNSERAGARRWQGGGQAGGSGVHAPRLSQQVPLLRASASGEGIHATGRSQGLYDYMCELAARLRRVRVCCGDWRRILTPSVTTYIGLTGVFLDPPVLARRTGDLLRRGSRHLG